MRRKPSLPRRFGAGIDEVEHAARVSDTTAAGVSLHKQLHVGHLHVRCARERIYSRNRGIDGIPARKIQGSARRRGYPYPIDDLNLVLRQAIRPSSDTDGTMAVVVDQLSRLGGLDPFR